MTDLAVQKHLMVQNAAVHLWSGADDMVDIGSIVGEFHWLPDCFQAIFNVLILTLNRQGQGY